jgi:hypothetical protein
MTRIRIVGLCLVAAFAIMAVASAGASAAAPEYLVCAKTAKNAEKKYTGEYTDKLCSSKSATHEGKYELESWEHAKKLGFKTKSGTGTLDVYIPGTGVVGTTTCAKSKDVGTITGAKTATDVVLFEKCESSGKQCTGDQPGTKPGDIETYTLDETLFASAESKTGVAEEVKGGGPGGESAAFDCEGEEISTTGAVSGEVTGDVGVVSKVSHVVFETTLEGAPKIASSEPLLTTIVGVGTLPSGETVDTESKGEAIEIS